MSATLTALLALNFAIVDRVEGDTVILEYRGEMFDACQHCFGSAIPTEGDLVAFPATCSEIKPLRGQFLAAADESR